MKPELRALLVVLGIFVAGALGYRILFGDGAGERFRVVSVSGDVRHETAQGGGAAVAGATLAEGDRIVSGDGAQAVLGLGEGTRVAVDARSSVKVLGITDDGVRVELEGGKVTATVRPDGGRLGVTSGGTEFTADDADFTVVRGEDGTVGVATERGRVSATGPGGTEELTAGTELVVPTGGSPLRAPASEALLLQVAWPAPRTRESEVELEGSTQPGATITVTGGARPVSARAGADGTFRVKVPLGEGKNALAVRATSVLGRAAPVANAELVRDTRAPSVGVTLDF